MIQVYLAVGLNLLSYQFHGELQLSSMEDPLDAGILFLFKQIYLSVYIEILVDTFIRKTGVI